MVLGPWSKCCDYLAYLCVHLLIVEHADKLFEEDLAGNLLVERCLAPVHHDVEHSERKEDHAQLRHLQAPQQLFCHELRTKQTSTISLRESSQAKATAKLYHPGSVAVLTARRSD